MDFHFGFWFGCLPAALWVVVSLACASVFGVVGGLFFALASVICLRGVAGGVCLCLRWHP
ncbi:hypothetical protein PCAR4_1490002 [Paraburkholderia caribensis]|nr:hypothetical protein PCAR4_1490002 [Paraburkholderia caribensis]